MKCLSALFPAIYTAITLEMLKLAVYQGDSQLFEWGPRIPEISPVWPLLAVLALATIGFLAVRKINQREVKKPTVAAENAAASTS